MLDQLENVDLYQAKTTLPAVPDSPTPAHLPRLRHRSSARHPRSMLFQPTVQITVIGLTEKLPLRRYTPTLLTQIRATFERRKTPLPTTTPVALTATFAETR